MVTTSYPNTVDHFVYEQEIEEFHCVFCGHVFESIEDSGTHECLQIIAADNERFEVVE